MAKVNDLNSKKSDLNLQALRVLETLLATKNLSKKRLYFQNFLRGVFFSIGSVVGVVLVGTVVLWILSLFDSLPFIEQISNTIKHSIK